MLTIQLLKPGRDTMDLLSDRNLQSRHQIWRQTPNLVPWEKSRYRKGTFRVYIKCLIVASSKVTIKRRGRKKGHCLSYRFERYMEFGDASVEEALPAHPNKKDLTKSLRMQIVSMLQGMENDGSLPRGSVTAIAKRFGVACCTVHRLWKRAVHTRATGLINSPDFNSRKNIPGDHLFIQLSLFMKVSRTCR